MRFITASKIHNGQEWLPDNSVIEIGDDGTILAIHASGNIPSEKIKFYEGILCPGFVNAHCHLELSHLKDKVEEGTRLIPFLQSVTKFRNHFSEEEKLIALQEAFLETKNNGIVAVGDIANSLDTLKNRQDADFHVHTFVETLGFIPETAQDRFRYSEQILLQFRKNSKSNKGFQLSQSLSPHAAYSNSSALFSLINDYDKQSIVTIHNQETETENTLFQERKGQFVDFYAGFPLDISFFKATHKTSLQTYLPWISKSHPLILVHNTFITPPDLKILKELERNVFFCICANANWYIERQLPPIELIDENEFKICLGTDSLASNHELSIFSEMQFIKKHFPKLSWEKLLRWATFNGAEALQLSQVGKIKQGKRPGIVQLFGADFESMKLICSV